MMHDGTKKESRDNLQIHDPKAWLVIVHQNKIRICSFFDSLHECVVFGIANPLGERFHAGLDVVGLVALRATKIKDFRIGLLS